MNQLRRILKSTASSGAAEEDEPDSASAGAGNMMKPPKVRMETFMLISI